MKEKIKEFLKQKPILKKYLTVIIEGGNIGKAKPRRKIKGKSNKIKIEKSALLYNCYFDIIGNGNEIQIGAQSRFNNVTFFIRGNNNKIQIARNVRFTDGGSLWIEDFNGEVNIDQDSSFEDVHIAVTEPGSRINIGEDCMFSSGIDLRTGDSHSIINAKSSERLNYAQNINIGNHVWIGNGVSILKGVNIAANSVVATRALVTRKFEDENILIAGIPAKKVKENIDWRRERIYDQNLVSEEDKAH